MISTRLEQEKKLWEGPEVKQKNYHLQQMNPWKEQITLKDWIQETCLISAVTSGPTEPKTFQEAWHSPVEEERNNWQLAIRKEIKSMIDRGVWRKVDRNNIPNNRRLIGNKWVIKIKKMVPTEQG